MLLFPCSITIIQLCYCFSDNYCSVGLSFLTKKLNVPHCQENVFFLITVNQFFNILKENIEQFKRNQFVEERKI